MDMDRARADDRRFLVVGGGISGLYAALLLARRGQRVRVVEREARLGGLAGAELFRGLPCDLGSHRLHPAALAEPLFREIHRETPFLTRPRRGVLLVGDRRVPYPPSAPSLALSIARTIGPRASLRMALEVLSRGARGRRDASARWESGRAALSESDDIGFERFVRARVGDTAYEAFYKPYAEKVWGLDPSELSQIVAKKRVSSTSPLQIIRRFAGRASAIAARGTAGSAGSMSSFVYPRGGASSITAYLEARLLELGVPIERGSPHALRDARGEITLFAGDLSSLLPGDELQHRGLYLVYLALPTPRLAEQETYYCPDSSLWFGRVSELQNYSPELRRAGETILCVEIPEGAWGPGVNFTEGPRLNELLAQLARARIIPRDLRPIEVRQRFLPRVYPLYRRGFLSVYRRVMARVAELGSVIPFGRQALFLHINLDHCAAIAEAAVDFALDAPSESGRLDVRPWLRRAERYLETTVRD